MKAWVTPLPQGVNMTLVKRLLSMKVWVTPIGCTLQKKVVKNAHLLNIIKLDTHVVHLTEEGRARMLIF